MSGPFGTSSWMYGIDSSFYDYKINQSLKLDDASGAYLTISSASPTATDRKKVAISCWVKRSTQAAEVHTLFWGSVAGLMMQFNSSGHIYIYDNNAGGFQATTTQFFRDFSAWYNFVLIIDTTQATAANRAKFYVNGELLSLNSYPSQNSLMTWHTGSTMRIGSVGDAQDLAGYIAEFISIDGQNVSISDLGETKEGIWIPKDVSGLTLGNAGFYLKFDNSSNIGNDSGSNNIDFTGSNLVAKDIMPDSPSNNFATLNPLAAEDVNIKSSAVFSEGNLVTATAGFGNGTPWGGGQSTIAIPTDKKIYCEVLCSNQQGNYWGAGVSIPELNANSTGSTNTGMISAYNRSVMINGVETDYGSSAGLGGLGVSKLAVDDILQIAVDGATGKVWFGRNGSYFKSPSTNNSGTTGNPVAGTHEIGTITNANGKPLFIVIIGGSATCHINFGADSSFAGRKTSGSANASDVNEIGDFYYAPPTDYLALCSNNMSNLTIGPEQDTQANDHFNTLLYNGNGSTGQSITGVGFKPEFLWIKNRNITGGYPHLLRDAVRGVTKSVRSDNTIAEETRNEVTSFDADGFTLAGINSLENDQSGNYVSWNWKAGGATPSQTYVVKVVSDSGNKYRFDDFGTSAITLNLQEGGTYTFDQSDSSNSGHPFRFSTTANGSHGGGSEYTTGVVTTGVAGNAGAKVTITVAASAPTLYYYCTAHSGMGGQVNTNSTFGSTNLKGATQAVVSTNTDAGFSIISYTGTGSTTTFGHGLSVQPEMLFFKNRDVTKSWMVLTKPNQTTYLTLNDASAPQPGYYLSGNTFDTRMTNSLITVDGSTTEVNTNGEAYICYAFASIKGYSKIGDYYGNSSANGTFVYTGFRPAWVMLKKVDSTTYNWNIHDTTRDTSNPDTTNLFADTTNIENGIGNATDWRIDILSNGFKMRENTNYINQSGKRVVFLAFAEAPFKFSNAR